MYFRVIRKIDGNGLSAGIRVSGIIYRVINEHVGLCTRNESLVLRSARQGFLQVRKHGDILPQLLGTFEVLQENEAFVCCLEPVDSVLIVLDRADYDIHLAVLHVHPCEVRLIVVICPESLGTFQEEIPDTLLDRHCGSPFEITCYLFYALLICVMIPYDLQIAGLIPADEGVRTVLGRIVEGIELLRGHILRIEPRTGRSRAITFDKRLVAVHPVPRAVIDEGIFLGWAVRQGENQILVPENLLPIDIVHLVCSETEEVQDLLAIVRKTLHIRRTYLESSIGIHFVLERRYWSMPVSATAK